MESRPLEVESHDAEVLAKEKEGCVFWYKPDQASDSGRMACHTASVACVSEPLPCKKYLLGFWVLAAACKRLTDPELPRT